jgi:hypothetical protein
MRQVTNSAGQKHILTLSLLSVLFSVCRPNGRKSKDWRDGEAVPISFKMNCVQGFAEGRE